MNNSKLYNRNGVVKFCCYSNERNNNTKTASESYRFLKDAVLNAVQVYLNETQESMLNVQFAYGCDILPMGEPSVNNRGSVENKTAEDREAQYVAVEPRHSFSRLIVSDSTLKLLMRGVKLFENYDLIFNKWGLKGNSPNPSVALNFYGSTGTGKTLAAHAIADHLNKKIIEASYAQIENKYHGEGPKNVEAIFSAAEKQDAILFIDEADSLLSSRLKNPESGSDNAINSMRSQFLICLEKYRGIVIFATNLFSNYDKAIASRIRSIEIPLPDEECRRKIWKLHLPDTFPIAEDVVLSELAKIDDICGREIRNAVQCVAESMAIDGVEKATLRMFQDEIDRIKKERIAKESKKTTLTLKDDEKDVFTEVLDEVTSKKVEAQES